MMSPDIRLLIPIQALDDAIAELSAEIDSLPKHIAAIEKKLHAGESKLRADKEALAANQKSNRDLEGEIADHNAKISKLKGQMLQAKTNEQYKAFQHEIDFNEDAIRTAEDRQLSLMEQAESLTANVAGAEAALKVVWLAHPLPSMPRAEIPAAANSRRESGGTFLFGIGLVRVYSNFPGCVWGERPHRRIRRLHLFC